MLSTLITLTATAAPESMNIEGLITDLAFILILGAVTTIIFKLLKQPVVLGYIVAGFLASPNFTYLPSVTTESNIEFWGQIGIIVLLFSLGLEFSFKKLVNAGGSAVVTALIIVCGMMGVGYCVGRLMGFTFINALFLGGMMSMSSTTIIIKAFTDLGLRQRKFTSMVIAVLIVEDLFAVLMMVLLSSIAVNNSVEGGELLMNVGKLVFFLVMWFLVGVYLLPSLLNKARPMLSNETLLIVSMGLCLGMAVFSVACGFSLALGAFVIGSILAGTSFAERIERVTEPIKDLFGSVFFISVGMMVNPTVIANYWGPILILSIAVIVGMIVFGTFGMLITGQPLKIAMESGFSLTQIGEFAFIIASLGMSLGVLDATIYPIVVAVSVLTTFTTPYFIRMADPAYRLVAAHLPEKLRFLLERYSVRGAAGNQARELWMTMLKRYLWRVGLYSIVIIAIIILCLNYALPLLESLIPGWGKLLCAVLTILAMAPFILALIMPSFKRSEWQQLRASSARADVPLVVMRIFRFIIALSFIIYTISHIYGAKVGWGSGLLVFLAIIFLFSKQLARRTRIIESKFFYNLNEGDNRRSGVNNNLVSNYHLAYTKLGYGAPFVGKEIAHSGLRDKYRLNLMSIQRGSHLMYVPSGDTRLFPGDILGIVGTEEAIQRALPDIEYGGSEEATESTDDATRLLNVELRASSPLIGKSVVSAGIGKKYSALLIAVQRGEEYLPPSKEIEFEAGDILWMYGLAQRVAPMKG
ncbi:MAG: cation:proton antiporter [Candidatus Amulumruptor caecigallinarius]|nr:cation:proton antiporter [Candidatus Amulumruptor caecigallinarius]MCM1397724.1 cation:proton antiporter [Candidatus Amulumruptor caecigallinarius]MCM1454626.1 cation:proton antiporter [bacterium]